MDIDGFEEKPWRLQGIDVSDFFNFGMNEESWKEYCKQLVGICPFFFSESFGYMNIYGA